MEKVSATIADTTVTLNMNTATIAVQNTIRTLKITRHRMIAVASKTNVIIAELNFVSMIRITRQRTADV